MCLLQAEIMSSSTLHEDSKIQVCTAHEAYHYHYLHFHHKSEDNAMFRPFYLSGEEIFRLLVAILLPSFTIYNFEISEPEKRECRLNCNRVPLC